MIAKRANKLRDGITAEVQIGFPRLEATMEESDLTRELKLAKRAAREAGEILRGYWKREGLKVGSKGPDNPVTQADLEADSAIKKLLRDPFPSYGWLSEETVDNDDRLKCQLVLI